jgi:hypothetical protein
MALGLILHELRQTPPSSAPSRFPVAACGSDGLSVMTASWSPLGGERRPARRRADEHGLREHGHPRRHHLQPRGHLEQKYGPDGLELKSQSRSGRVADGLMAAMQKSVLIVEDEF